MPDLKLVEANEAFQNHTTDHGREHQHHEHEHDHDGWHDDHDHGTGWQEWGRVSFVAALLLVVWLHLVPRAGGIDMVAIAGVLIGGYPIFKEAIADLLERRMTMELSMTIALIAASAIGEFFTALLITVFVLIAEILEGMTVGRGRRAIQELLDLLPHTAEVRSAGQLAPRSVSELQPGDVVLVRPGGRIPVDGAVVSGHSFVDQSTITGESMPVEKVLGAAVYAGTINQSGTLQVKTERIG